MSTRNWLCESMAVCAAVLATTGSACLAASSDKPNIVVILADDLGYGELGCFGQTKIKTPYLDRMAAQGMRCTQVYSGSTVYGAQAEPNAAVAEMITRMDRDIGRLFDLLKELQLDENTIVFFTSDNGPVSVGGRDHEFFNADGGLRVAKGSLFEGGIRVPTIVRWPGRIQARTVSDAVWAHWDVLPTCAEIAGVKPPKNIDGVSVLPTLVGKDQPQLDDRCLYWEYGRNAKFTQAVRKGDWKALSIGLNGPISLYNLKTDMAETTDVASQQPSIVAQFKKYLATARSESKDFPIAFNRKPEKKDSRSADNRK